ncbi:MAG: hypothetical protein IJH32_05460 [Ruminococcus sp.]|nr:hypothetical protein [Ruminococcus sp.]MBQ6336826.1 hypothetical protein [Ruminococcus sp.]
MPKYDFDKVYHFDPIYAVQDEDVIGFLVENDIRLNITPSSNALLGRVPDLAHHPIAQLFRKGVGCYESSGVLYWSQFFIG